MGRQGHRRWSGQTCLQLYRLVTLSQNCCVETHRRYAQHKAWCVRSDPDPLACEQNSSSPSGSCSQLIQMQSVKACFPTSRRSIWKYGSIDWEEQSSSDYWFSSQRWLVRALSHQTTSCNLRLQHSEGGMAFESHGLSSPYASAWASPQCCQVRNLCRMWIFLCHLALKAPFHRNQSRSRCHSLKASHSYQLESHPARLRESTFQLERFASNIRWCRLARQVKLTPSTWSIRNHLTR